MNILQNIANAIFPTAKATPKPSGLIAVPNSNAVVMQIAKEFADNSRKDIQDWRQALDLAMHPETPRWFLLQDIFKYLSVDAHLKSQIELRKAATLSHKYNVYDVATGKENTELTNILNSKWFFDFLSLVIDAKLFGYRIIELQTTGKLSFAHIPNRNVIPQQKAVLLKVSEDKVVKYNEPIFANTIIEVLTDDLLGVMNDIVPNLIWKKNAIQAWSDFSEKYGNPLITATTNKSDKKTLDKMEAMLRALGESAQAIFPEGTTLDVKSLMGSGDPYMIYDKQIERHNSEISKRIVGGTMISDNGSSRSQSETHNDNFTKLITQSDRQFCEFVINDSLFPLLAANGLPFGDGVRFRFDTSETLGLKEQFEIAIQAIDKGFILDDKWMSEQFNLPIIGKKETTEEKSKEDKPNNKGDANFSMAANVHGFSLAALGMLNIPTYKATCSHHAQPTAAIEVSIVELLTKLSEQLIEHVYNGKDVLKLLAKKATLTGQTLTNALYKSWGANLDKLQYDATDFAALSAMEQNIFRFSYLKEEAGIFAINDLLIDKETKKLREYNDFKNLASDLLIEQLDKRHLATQYNHAVAVGQMSSRWLEFKRDKDYKSWQYDTVGDDLVRNTHQAMDGLVFDYDDKEAARLFPPNGWNCRCDALQFDGPKNRQRTSGKRGVELMAWNEKQEKDFGFNFAEQKVVFSRNQDYMKELNLADKISKLNYETYGLKPIADVQKGKPKLNLDKTITQQNVHELWKPEKDGKMYFKDQLNRVLQLPKKAFEKVIDSNKQAQYFGKISSIINKADEVYLNNYSDANFSITHIKHYNDVSIATVAKYNNDFYTITAFRVANDNDRTGLLINK